MKLHAIGLAALFLALSGGSAIAQDLTMSQIGGIGFTFYGTAESKAAYSFSTTTCNPDDLPLSWEFAEQHPVTGQSLYRVMDGRIEQLGYGWLKHGFCALNQAGCGACQATPCDTLGAGCATSNSSGILDGQFGGAKSDMDATTGSHEHPPTPPTLGHPMLRGRLQADVADLALPGAVYVAEVLSLSEHDHGAGNARNNASWREVDVQPNLTMTGAGHPTVVGDPAIFAWPACEPSAAVNEVVSFHEGGPDVHGYYFLGYRVEQVDAGHWRYDYALQNLNSDRAASSLAIPIPCGGVEITDPFFRDVDPHSGEIWSGDDWTVDTTGGFVRWQSTETFAENENAGVIRWGTMFSFGFTANLPAADALAEIGLFEPGAPRTLTSAVSGPCGTPICGAANYCSTSPNTAGPGAVIGYEGSTSLSRGDLTLTGQGATGSQFGLFFFGTSATQQPLGEGFLCIGSVTDRLNPPQQASPLGALERALDFAAAPLDVVTVGATWYFQLWYRDPLAGGSGFNLSDGLAVGFCP